MTNFLSKTSFWEKAIGYERKLTAQKYLLKNSKNVGMAVDSDCAVAHVLVLVVVMHHVLAAPRHHALVVPQHHNSDLSSIQMKDEFYNIKLKESLSSLFQLNHMIK